jgi:predicted nucleotidyltransferase
MSAKLNEILQLYIVQVKENLGTDFDDAILYGSCARNEDTDDSDIDIAIFTDVIATDFYKLVDKIAEITFEFNVKYDVLLSPVFVNRNDYQRMVKILPYYQSIQKEGIKIG